MSFSQRILLERETIMFDAVKMHKVIYKSVLALHKYFASEFYYIPLPKMETIFLTFLQFLRINMHVFYDLNTTNESKFFTMNRSQPLYSLFSAECIVNFKIFLKRNDLRESILDDPQKSAHLIEFLNDLDQVISITTNWPIDTLKERNKQAILQYTLNTFDLIITTFKFAEMYKLNLVSEKPLLRSKPED